MKALLENISFGIFCALIAIGFQSIIDAKLADMENEIYRQETGHSVLNFGIVESTSASTFTTKDTVSFAGIKKGDFVVVAKMYPLQHRRQ